MIPSFSFNNIDFSTENGKYSGTFKFTHSSSQTGSPNKNRLEGKVITNEQKEHQVDLIFGYSTSGSTLRIVGANNIDKKSFALSVTPKLGLGNAKCKIEGTYGSRSITLTTDLGFNAITKVLETIISFVV